MGIQFGCQQKMHNDSTELLSKLTCLCVGEPEKIMKYSRFFGCGTLYVVITYFIITI